MVHWLEGEEINVGDPAAAFVDRGVTDGRSPWLDHNELIDLLAIAGDDGGYAYALVCLLGSNGLRVSEACSPDVGDLGGARYQPTLRIVGRGDKPAEVRLHPRTHEAIDKALDGRAQRGPLLLNRWRNRMQRHNAAAIVTRLARRIGVARRVTPHALRRSYITIGLLQGVPRREIQRAARHTTADTTVVMVDHPATCPGAAVRSISRSSHRK